MTMKRTKAIRSTTDLTTEQLNQLRKDRALIARELPDLAAKHQRLCDAAQEPTHSGALRRAVHASQILLDELADRAETDLDTLAGFLTGQRMLTSDVIDRLTKILQLKLEPANGKPKPRRAKTH
ncbi:MAG TPA: hypothetical protein PK867_19970 [Pirellulales bacterium]|nr:hypothetical protein [Pirellulales bacterium]